MNHQAVGVHAALLLGLEHRDVIAGQMRQPSRSQTGHAAADNGNFLTHAQQSPER